jgi:hypothetical protein
MTIRGIQIGTAGEHLVCADLLTKGHNAFLSSAGLPYDVVLDAGDGRLLRVAVKSCSKPSHRPEKEGNRFCYQFSVGRPRKFGRVGLPLKNDQRRITSTEADIVALCALDVKVVAYVHIRECSSSMHLDPPGALRPISNRGTVLGRPRHCFDVFTLERAIGISTNQIEPFPSKWRAA